MNSLTSLNKRSLRHDEPGARVVLTGAPNAGKSSLLNLLENNVAIVTDVPGTTRDVSEVITLAGIAIDLSDTAGIRDATDAIERRALTALEQGTADADVIVEVIDDSELSTAGQLLPPQNCQLSASITRFIQSTRGRLQSHLQRV